MRAERTTKREVTAFRADVAAGRGRAMQLVRRTRGRGLEREIERASLRARARDPQIEGSWGEWLYEMARIAGRVEALAPRIRRALARTAARDDSWDQVQRFEWLAAHARRGDEVARDAVQRAYLDPTRRLVGFVDESYLRAMKTPGFRPAWRFVRDIDDDFTRREWLRTASVVLGRKRVERFAGTQLVVRLLRKQRKRARRAEPQWTWREVEDAISGVQRVPGLALRKWARAATARKLARLDRRFAIELDRDALAKLLSVFSVRPLDVGLPRARALARSRDEQLADAAITALAVAADRESLEAARAKLRRSRCLRDARWLPLFAALGDDTDARELARLLPSRPRAQLAFETGLAVIEWADRSRSKALAPLLEWTWDHTPCSHCREEVLCALIRRRCVPERVLREARFDAVREIGALAHRSVRSRARG